MTFHLEAREFQIYKIKPAFYRIIENRFKHN